MPLTMHNKDASKTLDLSSMVLFAYTVVASTTAADIRIDSGVVHQCNSTFFSRKMDSRQN